MKSLRQWCYDEGGQMFDYVNVAEAEKLEAEIKRLQTIVDACAVSDDAPCHFCGEPVEPLSAHPGRWPLYFPEPKEPGECKAHHVQCVVERLALVDKLPGGVSVVPGVKMFHHYTE